jgi:hypothetical protein
MTQININNLTPEQKLELSKQLASSAKAEREENRKSYEELKEDIIFDLIGDAKLISNRLSEFKNCAMEEMGTLYKLLQTYSKRHEDGKGNFQIENKEGTSRIRYSRQELGCFDERSEQAEKHIITFVSNRFEGDKDNQDFIRSLLERKRGALDIKMVQKLYSMEDRFEDENWKEGIKLLKESWKPRETRDYITF